MCQPPYTSTVQPSIKQFDVSQNSNMEGRLQSKLAVSLVAILTQLVLGCTSRENLSNNGKYVIQAFDSIEVYSRHRLTFNIDSLKTQVLNQISDSTSHEAAL